MNQKLWEDCVEFHGHECPGLAIGFRASIEAMRILDIKRDVDEELYCITENDACGVDAVQVLTGCTLGKGNLIYRPVGKMAFSFYERKSGKSIRLMLKPMSQEMDRPQRQAFILNEPLDSIFKVSDTFYELPEKAKIFKNEICENCGETTAEHKIRLQEGKKLCLDCFTDYDRIIK